MKLARICMMAALASAAAAQNGLPTEPLCKAAWEGDLAQVRALLERGADPNLRDEAGRTPLMWASFVAVRSSVDSTVPVSRDYLAVATLLLAKGAAVDARDPSGDTALLLAMYGVASEYKVIGADEEIAHLLIAHGANVNTQDREGWSPLLRAVSLWADQPKLIAFLIAHKAEVTARLQDGRNVLMLAVRLGKTERLSPLLASGADVNAADGKGETALMVAAEISWDKESQAMMKVLLTHGANPNLKDHDGLTAADLAAEAGYLDRAQYLLKNGAATKDLPAFLARARNYALFHEIAAGSVEAAKALLDQGADVNFRDASGTTVLMAAADNEYSGTKAILLLDHGAEVNAQGKDRQTALMIAVDKYQPETVAALLAHGAEVNAADSEGNSVLLRAAASRRSWLEERQPLIHLLLEKGADVNARSRRGVTAAMLLAGEGNPALKLLLAKGADVNARDDEGDTPLLYAARHFARGGQRNCGWWLLENGADVNAANHRGETALILAATQYEPDAARLLLAKGANVNLRTAAGRTALMQSIDGPKEFDNEKHVVFSPQIAKVLIDSGADVNVADNQGVTALSLALERGYADIAAELRRAGARQ